MRKSKRKALLAILRDVPYYIDLESASWKHTDISEDLLKQWAEQLAGMRQFDLGFAGLGLGGLQISKGDLSRIGLIDPQAAAMARHLCIPTDLHLGDHLDFRPVFTGDEIDRRVQAAAKLCLEKVTPWNVKGIPTS